MKMFVPKSMVAGRAEAFHNRSHVLLVLRSRSEERGILDLHRGFPLLGGNDVTLEFPTDMKRNGLTSIQGRKDVLGLVAQID